MEQVGGEMARWQPAEDTKPQRPPWRLCVLDVRGSDRWCDPTLTSLSGCCREDGLCRDRQGGSAIDDGGMTG